jgi:hypothetical protein
MSQLLKALLGGMLVVTTVAADDLPEHLTPLGAEKAANADGSIPSWEGGIKAPPAAYKEGGDHPDPFADDALLFTITAANYKEYEANLTEGQKALLTTYPDSFKIPVYQTRRSASYPEYIYEETAKNAKRVKLTNNGNGIEGSAAGFPFPMPEHGQQVMWNHNLRFVTPNTIKLYSNSAVVQPNGDYRMSKSVTQLKFYYHDEDVDADDLDNRFVKAIGKSLTGRDAGEAFLVHVPLDRTIEETDVWIYTPGTRVKKIANFGYDGTIHDGLVTHDQIAMFNGPLDRYNWKLVGKKEIYVPYNAYRLSSNKVQYDDIVKQAHPNPDLTRYEKHRVWVVEANVKDGISHIYQKRVFYLDEDSWTVMAQDIYDQRLEFWRYAELHAMNYYEVPAVLPSVEAHYDLQSRRYVVVGMTNQEDQPEFGVRMKETLFKPAGFKRFAERMR